MSLLTREQIDEFNQNGMIVVRQVVDEHALKEFRTTVDKHIERYFGDKEHFKEFVVCNDSTFNDWFMWRYDEGFKKALLEFPCAQLAGEAMGCHEARVFFDNLITRFPHGEERTPWHHDPPSHPFAGKNIARTWLALDDVDENSGGVECILGSHLWDGWFAPVSFADEDCVKGYDVSQYHAMPDVDAHREDYQIVCPTLKAGDVILFHPKIVHGSGYNHSDKIRRGFTTFWFGDDITYEPRPWHLHFPKDINLNEGESVKQAPELFFLAWQKEPAADDHT